MSIASQLAAISRTSPAKTKPFVARTYLGTRLCKCCGEPERITDYGNNVRYSTISQNLHMCSACINIELSQITPS